MIAAVGPAVTGWQVGEVVGVVLADNTGMPHLLDADGRHWNSTIDSGERSMRAELPADHPPPDP